MEPLRAGDPRTVGPYVLIARLGAGGMGQVFLGRTRGGRTVAVKVVKAELAQDREFRRRFRQEVAAARLVSGRFTAAVVDADPEAATPWLATAYVSGLTLRAVVGAGSLLPETSLRVLAYGLARALAEIHAAGVVHRDMKPSNVMLAVDGPHVIDFGISRVIAAADLTRTDVGTIIGSPGFMSPEQTQGWELTGATDVFSLGTVLAYAATGRNPFGGGPEHALLYRIAHGEPDLSGVPDSLAPLIAVCLAKEPARRPSTAQIIGRMADSVPEGAWLPADLTAAIAQSAAEILDYEGIAVFPQPDNDPLITPGPAPDPTLVLNAGATRPTARLEPVGERTAERIGVGEPPHGARNGAGGAGLVAGLLSVAVIAALATALVLVLRNGNHNPGTPPAASVGTSTSQSPLTRSVETTTTSQTPTTTPTPTTSSPPMPTTPVPTSAPTSVPSTTASTSASTTQSTSAPSSPSSTTSSSAAPSSSPSTTHSSPAATTAASSSHS
ncbi:serine/threonine protein kinase [Catenulispora sp. MAP5-51]|uniref:serine/threonine-protein kinase n=1 Tax=Catenulispora sp. MAP5-51 TaxID=3156298 RepID=UPI0035132808